MQHQATTKTDIRAFTRRCSDGIDGRHYRLLESRAFNDIIYAAGFIAAVESIDRAKPWRRRDEIRMDMEREFLSYDIFGR